MLKTKEKFTLAWIDAYNTFNWRNEDIPIEDDIDVDDTGVLSLSGIKNVKDSFPNTEIDSYDEDGWIDCSHYFEFTASSIEEVKNIVNEYLEEIGRNVDVFSVLNSKKEIVLTEDQ